MAAPNQQPLSSSPGVAYKPYQSHRRTASARSSISTPSAGGPSIPPRPGPSSLAKSAGDNSRSDDKTVSDNVARSASSSAILRPSPSPATATATTPSPLTKQHDSLDAPPPLRKLQSKAPPATSGNSSTSQVAASASQGRSLARAPPPSTSRRSPLSAATETSTPQRYDTVRSSSPAAELDQRSTSPSVPPSPLAFAPHIASPKANGAAARLNGERSAQSAFANGRSQNANNAPTNLDRFSFQLPVAKGISTAQALRMRELQDHSSSGSPSMSTAGESSGGSSAHSSRAQSPVPPTTMSRNGGGSSMSGFDAMYAAQQQAQQKSSSSRLAPPFSANSRSGSFQPRGVSRSQLPEFLEAKSLKRSKKKQQRGGGLVVAQDQEREDERIRRRVEKLLAIHYPALTESSTTTIPASSSFSSSLLSTLAPHSRFLTTLQRSSNLRAAEQALVPWQPDDSINACPLCTKAFGVGRRKHHCRGCGKVVCASPEVSANPPPGAMPMLDEREGQPASKCSNIVIKDERALAAASAVGGSGGEALLAIKDLPPEVSLEALLSQSKPGQASTAASKSVLEASQHGFRLCRECKTVVLRTHYLLEEGEAPEYIRFYDQLMVLQKEIEQSLPEFQELVMGLQKQDTSSTLGLESAANGSSSPPSSPSSRRGSASGPTLSRAALLQLQRDAATARKQLLANFANYDALARRIRDLPDGGNNSLKRIKDGVDRKAAAFLQMNMFPLQSLPKFDAASAASSSTAASKKGPNTSGTSSPKASGKKSLTPAEQDQLIVLQEQHTQIASFLSRAQKERKLTDVVLLKRNLEELEQEMSRLTTR